MDEPAKFDEAWRKASSQYDAPRADLLKEVDRVGREGPFRPDWESLRQYEVPEWYKDAKFGIFIHWGAYSVPAFGNEWYPRNMYRAGSPEYQHHIATYGPQDKFGYKDFLPMFKAEHFDPAAWARLFKEAGAKYVVPVAEHHDGFAMYDSGLSDWTAAKMGPHRDVIGDLAKAVRAEGLHFGASTHRVEHNFFLGVGRTISSDVNDPKYAAFYGPAHNWLEAKRGAGLADDFTYVSTAWADDWLARSSEIVEKYHPDLIYFDWWIGQPSIRLYLPRFAAFYYNASLKYGDHVGVINYKDYAMQDHSAVLDLERGQLGDIRKLYWQTDTPVSNKSWGYIKDDTFKSPEFIVRQLADIVSKNGNLLLNIGPRSDGTIPEEAQQVLRDVGSWLGVNGEAVYGTRPWKMFGEGPTRVAAGSFHDTDTAAYSAEDFRFTTKGGNLYAIELGWPSSGEAVIHSLGTNGMGGDRVVSVALLGSGDKLGFRQQPDALHIQVPRAAPGKYAYSFRIGIESAQLAPTPPMGWNSWDSYGRTITEADLRGTADWMAKHLKGFGWQYVVVDEGWYLLNPEKAGTPELKYSMTADGRYIPAPERFPSSANGAGFKELADYIHSLGLKFGLHIIRGIPREAVNQNLPIAGSTFHAADAADPSDTCPWNAYNYGVRANEAGQAYYDSIAKLYASWGVDFVKADCIADHPYKPDEIRMLHNALEKSGRPVVLSLSPGPTAVDKGEEVSKYAEMWRISDDFWDHWGPWAGHEWSQGLRAQFDTAAKWAAAFSTQGRWPDADMLPIGRLGPHPGEGQLRDTLLSRDEQRTMMTLWSIFRSPLIMGGDLRSNDEWTTSLLNNPAVIAVDQHSRENHAVITTSDVAVWTARPDSGTGYYVAVFNLGETERTIHYEWKQLGLPERAHSMRDLW
ncbi:MAG TPA: alpha-L-fucosidase, partial [Blastocatellia bacterium]|nr:alpha-L-fucosidase [Blastocatellia bacterium]